MEVQPLLVVSGAYSDKRQKHQQIFFPLLKNDLFFQKESAVKFFGFTKVLYFFYW